jgi:RND family efflux transporter MFP subunit
MIKKSLYICLIGFTLTGCNSKDGQNQKKNIVPTVTITSPIELNSSKQSEVNGLIESPQIVQIKNRVDGFIDSQNFQDGAFVHKGDVLYKIDDRQLKNQLTSLSANLKQSMLNLSNLEKQKNRMEKLVKVGGVSEQELDNTNTLIEKEKAIGSSFVAQIEKLKLDISFAIIKAPISGYIEKSQQPVGSYVQANGAMLTQIYVSSPLYFTVMLSSNEAKPSSGKITVGSNEKIGNLKYCDPMADNSGMVKCRYQFNADSKIEIGTMGKFTFNGAIKEGLFIPQECLVQGPNGRSVYIIKNNKAYIKRVETAQWVGSNVEILSGIEKTDKIAKTGIINLRDNIEIKVQK